MKTKSLLALAFVSSVAFISCSDDGSGINVPDDSRENAIASVSYTHLRAHET